MRTRVYLLASLASWCFTGVACALPHTYTVNYLADDADPNPGDGICAGNGNPSYGTLRAAVQTANAHAGASPRCAFLQILVFVGPRCAKNTL